MTETIENTGNDFFQSLSALVAKQVEERVAKTIEAEMKKYVVNKKLPPYINTSDFYDLTGISQKKQGYLRGSGQIAYSKNGRSITYKREDVEDFLETHRVPKKEEER